MPCAARGAWHNAHMLYYALRGAHGIKHICYAMRCICVTCTGLKPKKISALECLQLEAAKIEVTHPNVAARLLKSGKRVRNYYNAGKAGSSPSKRGPQTMKLTPALLKFAATRVTLRQHACLKSKSADIVAEIVEASQSRMSPISARSSIEISRLQQAHPESISHSSDNKKEARRVKFCTDANLKEWHLAADKFLVELGFAKHDPHVVADKHGGGFARITLLPKQHRRIAQVDESVLDDGSLNEQEAIVKDPRFPQVTAASKDSTPHTTLFT